MFRFNKLAALAGEKVINGIGEPVEIVKETCDAEYPLEDRNKNKYTINGRMWAFFTRPYDLDLYMAEDPEKETKKEVATSNPEEIKEKPEKKEEPKQSTDLKRKI